MVPYLIVRCTRFSAVGFHNAAAIPELAFDAALSYEIRVGPEQRPVLPIGSEAREAEERERPVAGALPGQEVAVVGTAVAAYQLHPAPGKALEGVNLARIDDVLDDASDHRRRTSRP